MSQEFATPVIQQPEKLKKKFCFASIMFLVVTGIYSINAFWGIRNFFSDIRFLSETGEMIAIRYLLIDFADILFFIVALFITVLLFAKKNNYLLGIPMLMFSAEYITISLAISNNVIFIIMYFLAALSYLVVAIYTFIVTAKKKPVPQALCIIPIVLFTLFFSGSFIWKRGLIFLIGDICLLVGMIFLLIWVTSPYKKNKAAKTAEVQPAPAAPVMPKPVAAPVQPVIENKPAEHTQTSPLFGTVDNETTVEPETMHQFVSPVQPVVEAKPEEDPERTLDYSYAEEFYPPVNMPAEKPEVKAEPEPKIKPDLQSEVEKQQAVMKLLTEYKKLLDSGVITQEDYDKKKNELLGL